jgi:hypothetical protein
MSLTHVGRITLFVVLCCPSYLCRNATTCSLSRSFEDKGLVSTIVAHYSNAFMSSLNASLPDCIDTCTEQIQASDKDSNASSPARKRDSFMKCCVWFRLQIYVEDAHQATVECCILFEREMHRSLAEAKPLTSEKEADIHLSCCVSANLLGGFFENIDSEARNCGRACHGESTQGEDIPCDCTHYIDRITWQRSSGAPHVHLPLECATENCLFRLVEDQVRNERHKWIQTVLRDIVFVNASARLALSEVLEHEGIDFELANLLQYPLLTSEDAFFLRLYESLSFPHHLLPEEVFRQDGSVACCDRPDGLCLREWCQGCHAWTGGSYHDNGSFIPQETGSRGSDASSYNCPPQPCVSPPHVVRVPLGYTPRSQLYLQAFQLDAALVFNVGRGQVASARVREEMHLKFARLYHGMVRAFGFGLDAVAEIKLRQAMLLRWETLVPKYIPLLPRPAVYEYLAHTGNIPLFSSLDFWEERNLLRASSAREYPALHGADPLPRQAAKRRPLCRRASMHRPDETIWSAPKWLQDVDDWGTSRDENSLGKWKRDFRTWRRSFHKEMRTMNAELHAMQQDESYMRHFQHPATSSGPHTPLGPRWDLTQPVWRGR